MDIQRLLRQQDLLMDFAPADKWQAIAQLIAHMVGQGRLTPGAAKAIENQVLARERSMSTGMEKGVAIPHAAVDEVQSVQACMGICPAENGLEFASIDTKPAHLIVLLLIPRTQKLLHIRTLADVARVLSVQAVRERLLHARDAREAWEALDVNPSPARE